MTHVFPRVFCHERGVRQPGEPTASPLQFENPSADHALRWILTAEDGEVFDVEISLDSWEAVRFPATLLQGWLIRYECGTTVSVHDIDNRRVRSIEVDPLELRPRGRAERVAVVTARGAQTREEQ